ncbi:GNAT family N-acetyltransferase [Brevundimonas aveniformis]|uniref:GNAT family N-acetyltransferase n=1 Tax=Brevundimonas aveniformis TaxID=370977 RepID=UPI0024903DDB|nr:N-acetyltransferase [Brevundimonas aveniformis]
MTEPAMNRPTLSVESAFDAGAVARVVEAAFGPGRYAKTAERLREGSNPEAGFVMRGEAGVIGSVRLWPIRVGALRATFLGPIAVDRTWREAGLGAALVEACIAWAREQGLPGILLVGDSPFFGRFGFERTDAVVLPGPVNPSRLLWLALDGEKPVGLARIG